MAKKYKCAYCENRLIRKDLIDHIDKSHKELIPEGYTSARLVYNQVNKVDHGKCRVCGKPTLWSEKSGRYEVLCGNPKCKEHMREEYKKNMLRVKGTYNILNDPEQQKKMLANRSISGQYKFQDGGVLTYTGSYEKKCLEFMDVVMQIPSKDILSPGPTLEYEYNGEKHFYITDFYYIPYNLIIEVKDGGDNLNTKDSASMRASREKTIEKEHIITDRGEYNYIRLTDNNFAQLIEVFMVIKEKLLGGDDSKTYRINESQIIIEDYFGESLEDIAGVIFGKRKLINNKYITLYHGTDLGNLKRIMPKSYNVGLRNSKPKMSSFWFNKLEYAATFATMTFVEMNLSEYDMLMILDDDMKVLIENKYETKVIDAIRGSKSYVYEKTIESSYVGYGHEGIFPEYTLDIPVVPDRHHIINDKYMMSAIKFVSESYIKFVKHKYKDGKMVYNSSPLQQGVNKMLYYDGIKDRTAKIKNAKACNEFYELSSCNTESFKTSFDNIVAFNQMLNNYEYIVPNNGNIITQVSDDDFVNNFRLLSPSEFEKYKGGVCWDYVVYEAYYFNKHFSDIPYGVYFEVLDNKADCPTHTFLIFKYDNKYYWFESSWKPMCGIYGGFNTEKDAVDYVMNELDDSKTTYTRYICKYDPLNSKMFGMNCEQYMGYFSSRVKPYKRPNSIKNPSIIRHGSRM